MFPRLDWPGPTSDFFGVAQDRLVAAAQYLDRGIMSDALPSAKVAPSSVILSRSEESLAGENPRLPQRTRQAAAVDLLRMTREEIVAAEACRPNAQRASG
jgi:hypothetical protein